MDLSQLENWIKQLKGLSEAVFPQMQEIVDRGTID
jgi:hypothetical protein